MKLYPPSLRSALLALIAAVGLAQTTPAVATFTDYGPTIKGYTIGAAQCFFWSQLPAPGFPLEIACRVNGTYHGIQVGDRTAATGGTFIYCDDGTFTMLPGLTAPVCKAGVNGGNFAWLITPNAAGGFTFELVAWPNGGKQDTTVGTF